MKAREKWFVMWLVIGFLFLVCIIQSGCGTIKGAAHDISWVADRVNKSIVLDEKKEIKNE